MGDQYNRVKANYGIDEALAESSESEADEYIRMSIEQLICIYRGTNQNQRHDSQEQKDDVS